MARIRRGAIVAAPLLSATQRSKRNYRSTLGRVDPPRQTARHSLLGSTGYGPTAFGVGGPGRDATARPLPHGLAPFPKSLPGACTRLARVVLLLASLSAMAFLMGCGGLEMAGSVTPTANPQVALYTVTLQATATVSVAFGKTTSYGLKTWSRSTPSGGGVVNILVAGMQANSTYHMQAQVTYSDGRTAKDSDHTFTTGSYSGSVLPVVTATTMPGQTPQPGIEMINAIEAEVEMAAVDLSGNLIWEYYDPTINRAVSNWLAPKQLENGDFIAIVTPNSSTALNVPPPSEAPDLVREFDLAGNTVKQITMSQLNASLAAAGYDLTLQLFSHDVLVLPNGHWIVLTNTLKDVVLNGDTTPTTVLGDVIVDLDTNLQPVWVWNEFDYLDVNRQPWHFPDWTHTNAIIYSQDDGDLLVSIRHQNWIVKVDYNNGNGTGDILWHLGAGGDMTLVGGIDPTDWSYAQHGISFTTPNTSGVFGLAVMDNGDDRAFPGGNPNVGVNCGAPGAPACYSTATIFEINENAKTATLLFHQIQPTNLYSSFGGNAQVLDNGDVEYDLCGLVPESSLTLEVTNSPDPQTVWSLSFANNYAYRSYRLPSLYPGVQW
jgi:arylsulfate sulfotransferase